MLPTFGYLLFRKTVCLAVNRWMSKVTGFDAWSTGQVTRKNQMKTSSAFCGNHYPMMLSAFIVAIHLLIWLWLDILPCVGILFSWSYVYWMQSDFSIGSQVSPQNMYQWTGSRPSFALSESLTTGDWLSSLIHNFNSICVKALRAFLERAVAHRTVIVAQIQKPSWSEELTSAVLSWTRLNRLPFEFLSVHAPFHPYFPFLVPPEMEPCSELRPWSDDLAWVYPEDAWFVSRCVWIQFRVFVRRVQCFAILLTMISILLSCLYIFCNLSCMWNTVPKK